jgi:hypothetical protein
VHIPDESRLVPAASVLRRRATGWVWFLFWVIVLVQVTLPWRDLGGVVEERLRWLHRFVLCTGFGAGEMLGRHARWQFTGRSGRYRRWLTRLLWHTPALAVASCLLVLHFQGGRMGEIGVTLTGFLSYWAGLDAGRAAFPLMHGRPYLPVLCASDDGKVC